MQQLKEKGTFIILDLEESKSYINDKIFIPHHLDMGFKEDEQCW